jgi:hypothetical protein
MDFFELGMKEMEGIKENAFFVSLIPSISFIPNSNEPQIRLK